MYTNDCYAWAMMNDRYVITNFFAIGVVKYCGAAFFYIVSAIVVPLTEVIIHITLSLLTHIVDI
jgi:hypothetical protein